MLAPSQQQDPVPPAALESGASWGSTGAARLRFCPVTETLATFGQAAAVVSASGHNEVTLRHGWPARDHGEMVGGSGEGPGSSEEGPVTSFSLGWCEMGKAGEAGKGLFMGCVSLIILVPLSLPRVLTATPNSPHG